VHNTTFEITKPIECLPTSHEARRVSLVERYDLVTKIVFELKKFFLMVIVGLKMTLKQGDITCIIGVGGPFSLRFKE
jgi:hypothetical protein